MINLFEINNYKIDTSRFSNLLHDKVVREFEKNFAEYVGAKHACSANSASSLIQLSNIKCPSIFEILEIKECEIIRCFKQFRFFKFKNFRAC